MTVRPVGAMSSKWLEWGMDSPQPGSQVRDAAGVMVFTGSAVRWQARAIPRGRVVELVSPTMVRVAWPGVEEGELLQAAKLLVLP